jgi:hypothetical protein
VETFVETFYKNTLDLLKNNGFFTSKIAKIKSENRCGTIKKRAFSRVFLKNARWWSRGESNPSMNLKNLAIATLFGFPWKLSWKLLTIYALPWYNLCVGFGDIFLLQERVRV